MQVFDDSEETSVTLMEEQLLRFPGSLLTVLWQWQRRNSADDSIVPYRLQRFTPANLQIIAAVYHGLPAPNPYLYSSRPYYNVYLDDGAEADLLDYLMLPLDFVLDDVIAPSEDDDEEPTIDTALADDFVANWPSSPSTATDEEDSDSDSWDEGIWD